MRRRAILALAAALPLPAFAQQPAMRGPLGHLARHVGGYDYGAVFADPAVAAGAQQLLGAQLPLLRRNMQVQVPIEFDGAWIILRGLAAHQGGVEEAIFAIAPATGLLEAAILTRGTILHLAQRPQAQAGPTVAAWIAERRDGGRIPVRFQMTPPAAAAGGKPG